MSTQQKEPSKSSRPSPAPPARARPWAPATWILGPSWRPPTSHPGSCHRTPGEDIHHVSRQGDNKAGEFSKEAIAIRKHTRTKQRSEAAAPRDWAGAGAYSVRSPNSVLCLVSSLYSTVHSSVRSLYSVPSPYFTVHSTICSPVSILYCALSDHYRTVLWQTFKVFYSLLLSIRY